MLPLSLFDQGWYFKSWDGRNDMPPIGNLFHRCCHAYVVEGPAPLFYVINSTYPDLNLNHRPNLQLESRVWLSECPNGKAFRLTLRLNLTITWRASYDHGSALFLKINGYVCGPDEANVFSWLCLLTIVLLLASLLDDRGEYIYSGRTVPLLQFHLENLCWVSHLSFWILCS